jgi:hypothetical protein
VKGGGAVASRRRGMVAIEGCVSNSALTSTAGCLANNVKGGGAITPRRTGMVVRRRGTD